MPNIIPIPQNNFQAPGFVQPRTYPGLMNSIDDLFNAYQQAKMANAQIENVQTQGDIARQNLGQGAANFEMQNLGLTPEDITKNMSAALQPPPNPVSMYATPSQPPSIIQAPGAVSQPGTGMGAQGPGVAQNGPQMPQEDPKITTLRNIMAMHLQGAQIGAAGQIAGVQNTQADTALKTGQAAQAQSEANMLSGGPGGSVISNIADQVASGQISPSMATDLMGRNQFARLGLANELSSRKLDLNQLESDYQAKKGGAESSARLTEGGTSQQMARSAQSAFNQFDNLQQISDGVSRFNNQLLNKPFLKIATTAAPGAASLMAGLAAARIEYARAASGSTSPSDTFMQEAQKALPDSITPQQLPGVIQTLKNSLSEIGKGQMTPASLNSVTKAQSNGAFNLASNPQALKIRADLQAGKITRQQARTQLMGLQQNQ